MIKKWVLALAIAAGAFVTPNVLAETASKDDTTVTIQSSLEYCMNVGPWALCLEVK